MRQDRQGSHRDEPFAHIEAFTTAPQGLPDVWSSPGAFTEMVGGYAEAGANEFTITQPRPDQDETAERMASEVFEFPAWDGEAIRRRLEAVWWGG